MDPYLSLLNSDHTKQMSHVLAPTSAAFAPLVHDVHSDEPSTDTYLPRLQGVHSVDPLPAYLPLYQSQSDE